MPVPANLRSDSDANRESMGFADAAHDEIKRAENSLPPRKTRLENKRILDQEMDNFFHQILRYAVLFFVIVASLVLF